MSITYTALNSLIPQQSFALWPGLVSWLRSDKNITLNGSTVSAWGDISLLQAKGASQGTAAQQPTYVASGGANNLPYLDC